MFSSLTWVDWVVLFFSAGGVVLVAIGAAYIVRHLTTVRVTLPPHFSRPKVRYVDFYESATPDCRWCRGTGWFVDRPERCLSPCMCTSMTEIPRGNA